MLGEKYVRSECSKIAILADRNPNYKGIMPHCIDCGIRLKSYPTHNTRAERCLGCEISRKKGICPDHLKPFCYEIGWNKKEKSLLNN